MKVKPTQYKGVWMRSKTEARCAQWLEDWGFVWLYEPESLLDGIQYTPDFYLPEIDTLIEVKPAIFFEETMRPRQLIERCHKVWVVLAPVNEGFGPLDMYGPLPPCDGYAPGGQWGWHSDAPGEREISLSDFNGCLSNAWFYMGAGCYLRETCPCTN
jgi:hypothetical protein